MINFISVTRNYGLKVAVANLNLTISSGELFALLGHNGAGKTTSIKMLVGLLHPSDGKIEVGGEDVTERPRETAAQIGYVPDQPYLYEKLSGREFLTFVADMYGLGSERSREGIEREIERFQLSSFVDDLTESYSHGMKQRTVFASAMLHNPRVLVVDEPLVGLDPHSIRLVKDLMRQEVAAGTCIFMSTHTLAVAEEIADRIGIVRQGNLIFEGTIDALRKEQASDESLEGLYLSLMEQQEV